MNYPFLAGYLEAELRNLAYDETFRKTKSFSDRQKYVEQIIKDAYAATTKFGNQDKAKVA